MSVVLSTVEERRGENSRTDFLFIFMQRQQDDSEKDGRGGRDGSGDRLLLPYRLELLLYHGLTSKPERIHLLIIPTPRRLSTAMKPINELPHNIYGQSYGHESE